MYFVKNTPWSVCCSCHVLSYHVLIHHLGRKFRKTEQPTETLCSYHLLRILYGYVHIHKYTHTHTHSQVLWNTKEKTALLLLFISVKDTIKIYRSISEFFQLRFHILLSVMYLFLSWLLKSIFKWRLSWL